MWGSSRCGAAPPVRRLRDKTFQRVQVKRIAAYGAGLLGAVLAAAGLFLLRSRVPLALSGSQRAIALAVLTVTLGYVEVRNAASHLPAAHRQLPQETIAKGPLRAMAQFGLEMGPGMRTFGRLSPRRVAHRHVVSVHVDEEDGLACVLHRDNVDTCGSACSPAVNRTPPK